MLGIKNKALSKIYPPHVVQTLNRVGAKAAQYGETVASVAVSAFNQHVESVCEK